MVGLLMPLKERLRELRTAAGLTQQALANQAGVSISAVVQIESGKIPDPRLSTLRALARVLGTTIDDLAGEDEPPAPEPEEKPARRGRKRKGE